MKKSLMLAGLAGLLMPHMAHPQDGSLAVCADLSAKAPDVAHHCRRALASGQLNEAQTFGAQTNLGDALIAIRQPDQAIDAFEAAIALLPQRVEPYVGRARALEDMKRTAEAAEDWDRAASLAPNSLDVRLDRGAFFLRNGSTDAALAEFDAAVRINPRDPDALFNRGLTLIAASRMPEAEADFTRLLADAPNDAGAYYHRGRARAGRDDRGALEDFETAARLAPQWSSPWFQSGQALERSGQVDAANQHFRRAFELGHKDPWLLDRIQQLGG
ncbi:MAG: tetratricopeptide repeat protein [Pseudomonadota bacterium]